GRGVDRRTPRPRGARAAPGDRPRPAAPPRRRGRAARRARGGAGERGAVAGDGRRGAAAGRRRRADRGRARRARRDRRPRPRPAAARRGDRRGRAARRRHLASGRPRRRRGDRAERGGRARRGGLAGGPAARGGAARRGVAAGRTVPGDGAGPDHRRCRMRLPLASGLATGAVALTLYPLFQHGTWFWSGLAVLIAVTAVGVLGSRFTVDRRLVPIVQLVVLGLVVTWIFAGEYAWAGIVPTRDPAYVLWLLLVGGFEDIQRYAAPVPDSTGITLIAAGGIGVIAILVDLFAVRLRRAALAGLPLLALFSVPAAVISDPIAWPVVVIAAFGYIGLLLSDGRERIGQWGRAVLLRRAHRPAASAPPGSPAAGGASFRLSGKRIGYAAIALAILVPALVPTLEPEPLFGFGPGGGPGGRGNTIT